MSSKRNQKDNESNFGDESSDVAETQSTAERLHEVLTKFPNVTNENPRQAKPEYYIQASPASIQLSRNGVKNRYPKNYSIRKTITEWSKKSRANMLRTLFELDYKPLFGDKKRLPVMVTLTYPGEWETVAPNGSETKRHLNIFRKRYARAFGETFNGIWKLEFQRRGAPHIHILTSVGIDLGEYQLWLSQEWADIVNHPDDVQRNNHMKSGTHVQIWFDIFRDKPYLIAHYFGKHSKTKNTSSREYQNRPPKLWTEAGNIGRFWGYWGLKKVKVGVRVTRADSLYLQRTLRRWKAANSEPAKVRVRRVNSVTGEITYRTVTRKVKRLKSQGGFISVTDGAEMTQTLFRALESTRVPLTNYVQGRYLQKSPHEVQGLPNSRKPKSRLRKLANYILQRVYVFATTLRSFLNAWRGM